MTICEGFTTDGAGTLARCWCGRLAAHCARDLVMAAGPGRAYRVRRRGPWRYGCADHPPTLPAITWLPE